jgi:methylisocitrate lyase
MRPGERFRAALAAEQPLQIAGAVNAYSALLAQRAGFRALYVSGAGVANASFGLPDLGITQLADVVEDVRRISGRVDLPLLVDVDTGWGSAFNIARTVREIERAGAACVHIEDQVQAKRCGHRPGKAIVSREEMVDRVKAAVDARSDLQIMARTDALAVEGLDAAIDRSVACVEAGADFIFAEAMTDIAMYRRFAEAVKVPLLANITEFGQTPLYTREELGAQGVAMVLYPLSAFRAMARAAETVYGAIRGDGHQQKVLELMQTRTQLYEVLDYHSYEQTLDSLFSRGKEVPPGNL